MGATSKSTATSSLSNDRGDRWLTYGDSHLHAAAPPLKENRTPELAQLAEDVTGPYDVIVRAEARNLDELGKLVVARVQAVDGITRTLTCPVVRL